MEDNVRLAEASLEVAKRVGARRLLIASSSAVYGGSRPEPYAESDPVAPLMPYGASKARMEAVVRRQVPPGLECTFLRIGNVAGADALLLNDGQTGITIDRFADGQGPRRSYIGPRTLARVLAGLATHEGELPEVLNIGTPDPVDMANLATAAGFDWSFVDARPHAQATITLDVSQLDALLPFAPKDSDAAQMVAEWQDVRDG